MRLTNEQRMYRAVPEADVLRAVMDYIHRQGGYCYRQNSGAVVSVYHGKKRFTRYGEPGCSDVVAVLPTGDGQGITLFIETKTEVGKQSDEQKAWQAQIEAAGGRYLLVRPSSWQAEIDRALGVERNG